MPIRSEGVQEGVDTSHLTCARIEERRRHINQYVKPGYFMKNDVIAKSMERFQRQILWRSTFTFFDWNGYNLLHGPHFLWRTALDVFSKRMNGGQSVVACRHLNRKVLTYALLVN